MSDELIDVATAFCIAALSDGLARQPEKDSLFNTVTIRFLNYDFLKELSPKIYHHA